MSKTILISVATLAVLLLAALSFAAAKPNTYRIERSTRINARPERIFSLLEDFRQWALWSPYEMLDPYLTRTFNGPERGRGAVYEWKGDSQVGQGRLEITETSPPTKVTIKLDFIKPLEAHNTAEFTLELKGDQTQVTWAMHGPSPYLTKLMRTYFNLDGMIGGQFEQGLANLKTIAEK
jgi:uncharacterized protein YndB with AHSA1/START domain